MKNKIIKILQANHINASVMRDGRYVPESEKIADEILALSLYEKEFVEWLYNELSTSTDPSFEELYVSWRLKNKNK
jgi:hypothetical protein